MHSSFLEECYKYTELGLRDKAKESAKNFIASFNGEQEVESWAWSYLRGSPNSKNLRYEIFAELIFPTLLKGYRANKFEACLYLALSIQTIYNSNHLHKQISFISKIELLDKCYELEPSNRMVQDLLLYEELQWLNYSQHEWPSGILNGINGATASDCLGIYQKIEKVRKLDQLNEHSKFLNDYENKLTTYYNKIKNNA